jgi:hypothetical protein
MDATKRHNSTAGRCYTPPAFACEGTSGVATAGRCCTPVVVCEGAGWEVVTERCCTPPASACEGGVGVGGSRRIVACTSHALASERDGWGVRSRAPYHARTP